MRGNARDAEIGSPCVIREIPSMTGPDLRVERPCWPKIPVIESRPTLTLQVMHYGKAAQSLDVLPSQTTEGEGA